MKRFFIRLKWAKQHVDWIYEIAWQTVVDKQKEKANLVIQRTLRGYLERRTCIGEIEQLESIKDMLKIRRFVVKIQKWGRGYMVRVRMNRLDRCSAYVGGFLRMRWLRKWFLLQRKSCIMIQRWIRKTMYTKVIIATNMSKFLGDYKQFYTFQKNVDQCAMWLGQEKYEAALHRLQKYDGGKFSDQKRGKARNFPEVKSFIPAGKLDTQDMGTGMNEDYFCFNDVNLFSVVIDFDGVADTTDIYGRNWVLHYLGFVNNLYGNNNRLMQMDIGQTYSLAIGNDYQVYTWGLNDYTQLARIPADDERKVSYNPQVSETLSSITPKVVACGDDHGVMLSQQGDVYAWGSNAYGELGTGDNRLVQGLVHLENQGKGWRHVCAKGKHSYMINSSGQAYKWPNYENSDEEMRYTPQPLQISNPKVKFTNLSAGHDFMVGLTSSGSIFAHGLNTHGQLGLGDSHERQNFANVRYFGDHGDKISQVSCGHAHVIAKSATGGIFSWGFNANGQLGNGSKRDTNLPKFLRIASYKNNIFKARSVQAGYNQSYVLCEDEQVFFSGLNAMTSADEVLLRPVDYKLRLFRENKNLPFSPVKLVTKWSSTLSVTCLVLADFRDTNYSPESRAQMCKELSDAWEINQGHCTPYVSDPNSMSSSMPKATHTQSRQGGSKLSTQKLTASKNSRGTPVKPYTTSTVKKNTTAAKKNTPKSSAKNATTPSVKKQRVVKDYGLNSPAKMEKNDSVLEAQLKEMLNKNPNSYNSQELELLESIKKTGSG